MSDWLTIIAEAAQSEFEKGRALKLAQIPIILKRNGLDYKEHLSGRGLREALSLSGGEKLILINDPSDKLVWGVVPILANLTNFDIQSLFQRAPERERIPRFRRSFWTAFIKDIPSEERRFILPDVSFTHATTNIIPGQFWKEVLSTDIVGTDLLNQDDYDKAVLNKIREWCEREGVNIDNYIVQGHSSSDINPKSIARSLQFDLSKLSESELSRIAIPLDIVLKLIGK